MINKKVKEIVAKYTIVALGAFVLTESAVFAKSGDINNIRVKYDAGERAASTLTKNYSRKDGLVNLAEDNNSRWITARMRKGEREDNGYVAGVVTLREGTKSDFTNSGMKNTHYTLYISRTYKGDDPTSYVNGYWRADN